LSEAVYAQHLRLSEQLASEWAAIRETLWDRAALLLQQGRKMWRWFCLSSFPAPEKMN